MGKYFGTDGFRGEAGITLTADHAYKVGRFLGWYYNALRERNGDTDPARIVIGKDTRRSSYMFEYSLVAHTVTGHLCADFLGEMDEEQLDKLADDMGVDTTGKDKAEVVAAVAEEPVEVPDISKMKLDELKEFAEDNGIDLTGCTTKASILQKIREYEADAAAAAAIITPEG